MVISLVKTRLKNMHSIVVNPHHHQNSLIKKYVKIGQSKKMFSYLYSEENLIQDTYS